MRHIIMQESQNNAFYMTAPNLTYSSINPERAFLDFQVRGPCKKLPILPLQNFIVYFKPIGFCCDTPKGEFNAKLIYCGTSGKLISSAMQLLWILLCSVINTISHCYDLQAIFSNSETDENHNLPSNILYSWQS